MVLPIGFTVTRILSAGGDNWAAEDVSLNASTTFSQILADPDNSQFIFRVGISGDTEINAFDIADPTNLNWRKENYSKYSTSPSVVPHSRRSGQLQKSNFGTIRYSGTSYGIQTGAASQNGTNYGSNNPVIQSIRLSDGAEYNTYSYNRGVEAYNYGSCYAYINSMALGATNSNEYDLNGIWVTNGLNGTSGVYQFGQLRTPSGPQNFEYNYHGEHSTRTEIYSIATAKGSTDIHGISIAQAAASQYQGGGTTAATYRLNGGSSLPRIKPLANDNNFYINGGAYLFFTPSNLYTVLSDKAQSSTSYWVTVQKFAISDLITGPSTLQFGDDIMSFRSSAGSGTRDLMAGGLVVDSTNSYVYLALAANSTQAITIVRMNTANFDDISFLNITNPQFPDLVTSGGSYEAPDAFIDLDIYDDETLLVSVGKDSYAAALKISADLSVSAGTYGNFTFTSGQPSHIVTYNENTSSTSRYGNYSSNTLYSNSNYNWNSGNSLSDVVSGANGTVGYRNGGRCIFTPTSTEF